MEHWSTIFDIIEKGLAGDTTAMRAYTELLLARLEQAGDDKQSARLRRILAGDRRERGMMLGIEPWFQSNGGK